MKVICKETHGDYSPLVLPPAMFAESDYEDDIVSKEWYTIDSNISGYSLTENNEYNVYGLLIWRDDIRYLLQDDNNLPGFFPKGLFMVTENLIYDWSFYDYRIQDTVISLLGPAELFKGYNSFIGLVSNTPEMIRKFLTEKEHTLDYWG